MQQLQQMQQAAQSIANDQSSNVMKKAKTNNDLNIHGTTDISQNASRNSMGDGSSLGQSQQGLIHGMDQSGTGILGNQFNGMKQQADASFLLQQQQQAQQQQQQLQQQSQNSSHGGNDNMFSTNGMFGMGQ